MPKEKAKEEEAKEDVADEILGRVTNIIPGLGSFMKKAEKSRQFGQGIKKIREEIKKKFAGVNITNIKK